MEGKVKLKGSLGRGLVRIKDRFCLGKVVVGSMGCRSLWRKLGKFVRMIVIKLMMKKSSN